MTRPLLVLRPQPGADRTAARIRALGLEPIVAPLFEIVPRSWQVPDERLDGLLVTSANAARVLARDQLPDWPIYAVGPATAEALRKGGWPHVIAGTGDVSDVVRLARDQGMTSLLHLAGAARTEVDPLGVRIVVRTVYEAEDRTPSNWGHAIRCGAVALLHSSRAARRFRELAGPGHRVAALSAAVLDAAGPGWTETVVAATPTDEALLAAAARLCH